MVGILRSEKIKLPILIRALHGIWSGYAGEMGDHSYAGVGGCMNMDAHLQYHQLNFTTPLAASPAIESSE
jgi:hypothetical protein